MEEEWSAPVIHELTTSIDTKAGFFGDELCAVGILTIEGGSNFLIYAHRVPAVAGAIIGEDIAHVIEQGGGFHRRSGGGRAEEVGRFGPRRGGAGEWRDLTGGRGGGSVWRAGGSGGRGVGRGMR